MYKYINFILTNKLFKILHAINVILYLIQSKDEKPYESNSSSSSNVCPRANSYAISQRGKRNQQSSNTEARHREQFRNADKIYSIGGTCDDNEEINDKTKNGIYYDVTRSNYPR